MSHSFQLQKPRSAVTNGTLDSIKRTVLIYYKRWWVPLSIPGHMCYSGQEEWLLRHAMQSLYEIWVFYVHARIAIAKLSWRRLKKTKKQKKPQPILMLKSVDCERCLTKLFMDPKPTIPSISFYYKGSISWRTS